MHTHMSPAGRLPLQSIYMHAHTVSAIVPLSMPLSNCVQAVANKGEPFLSAVEASRDALSAYLARHSLRMVKYMGPKDMVAQQLPHAQWNDKKPPIASFYCYAAAIKP